MFGYAYPILSSPYSSYMGEKEIRWDDITHTNTLSHMGGWNPRDDLRASHFTTFRPPGSPHILA
jgi:hypothetical protein